MGATMRIMTSLALAASVALAGCSGTIVDFRPPLAAKPTQDDINDSAKYVAYIDNVAGSYLKSAGSYSNSAQGPDLVVMGAAAAAAAAASFGWSIDIIKAAGLTAAGAYAIREYYGVDQRVTALVDAVDGLNCLRGLSQSAQSKGLWSSASEEINGGVRRITTNVNRSSLRRQPVNYSDLVETMTQQAKAAAAFAAGNAATKNILNAKAVAAGSAENQQFIAELPGKVTACIATAGQGR